MAANRWLTLDEVAQRLEDRMSMFGRGGAEGSEIARRTVVRIAQDALDFLVGQHDWSYYFQVRKINLRAAYGEGTIAVDSATGVVTGSGTTFPSYSHEGRLLIGDVLYEIDSYDSATQITLKSTSLPTADVAAGTTYKILFDSVDLPDDLRQIEAVEDLTAGYTIKRINNDDFNKIQTSAATSNEPTFYTVMRSLNTGGRLALWFAPPPVNARHYNVLMRLRPRPTRIVQDDRGTLTTTAGSRTVTCSESVFNADNHVGSVLRISDGPRLTTEFGGTPASYSARITAVASGTSATVETAIDASLSSVPYRITDPIDVGDYMQAAYLSLCDLRLAQQLLMVPIEPDSQRPTATLLREYQFAYMQQLQSAMANDRRVVGNRHVLGERGAFRGYNIGPSPV